MTEMKPGDPVFYQGRAYELEKLELRGFGEAATHWALICQWAGSGKDHKIIDRKWVLASELGGKENDRPQ